MKSKVTVPLDSQVNFDRAVDFIREKMKGFDTDRLMVNIYLGEAEARYSGCCKYPIVKVKKPRGFSKGWYYDRKKGVYQVFVRISSKGDYPYKDKVKVGTIQVDKVPIPPKVLFQTKPDGSEKIWGKWNGKLLEKNDYSNDFYWIVEEVEERNLEDMTIDVTGHEIWHFLCHSGQMKGTGERNTQARANLEGIKWLREFQELYR